MSLEGSGEDTGPECLAARNWALIDQYVKERPMLKYRIWGTVNLKVAWDWEMDVSQLNPDDASSSAGRIRS